MDYWFWLLIRSDRVRLSRLVAIPAALLAILCLLQLLFAPNPGWLEIRLVFFFTAVAISVWMLGDWWKRREGRLKTAREGAPDRQRGFQVVPPADDPTKSTPKVHR